MKFSVIVDGFTDVAHSVDLAGPQQSGKQLSGEQEMEVSTAGLKCPKPALQPCNTGSQPS